MSGTIEPPADDRRDASNDVIVCRCEELRLGDLRAAFERGFDAPDTLKRATRITMGACQGRVCRPVYRALLRAWVETSTGEEPPPGGTGHIGTRPDSRASLPMRPGLDLPGSRPPVRPIRLGDLADLEPPDEEPTPSQGNR
jgi:hypothetical protein